MTVPDRPDPLRSARLRTLLTAAGAPPLRATAYVLPDTRLRLLYRTSTHADCAVNLLRAAGYVAIQTDRPSPNTYGISASFPSGP